MRATLLPLSGKYYGTEIEIRFDNGVTDTIELWNHGSFAPSNRELKECGLTRDQYNNNEIVDHDNFFGDIRARDALDVGDGHFESQETLENALSLIDAINTYG